MLFSCPVVSYPSKLWVPQPNNSLPLAPQAINLTHRYTGTTVDPSNFYTSLNVANYIISSVVILDNNGEERGCPHAVELEIQFVSHGVQTKWILLHALMLKDLDFHQNKLDHCFLIRKFNISYLKFI